MKKTIALVCLCLAAGFGTAQAQLKVDFGVAGGAVQDGYQAYVGTDKNLTSFTAQSYSAFGATVTVKPSWGSDVTAACVRMIDRGVTDVPEAPSLLRDWIGTDTRQPGDPMTLTITGLPAGTYEWVSYHHDRNDQTGIFSATVNDAAGSKTTTDIDISNGTNFKLDAVTKFTATIVSNGRSDVTVVFDQTSASSVVANAIFVMNAFDLTAVDTGAAVLPSPEIGQTDVPRDGTILSWVAHPDAVKHDVYFGTDQTAIDQATTASAGYKGSQDANSFDPGRLAFGQTYYWRIDEILSDNTTVKGGVWSFTAEPLSVALAGANITATASSSNSADEGPQKTVDGSGLTADGLHSVDTTQMWLSSSSDAGPVWIQYQFDKAYKLHQMLVWNHNGTIEPIIGFGVKNVTIEYSLDGAAWTAITSTTELTRAPGSAAYAADTTVDFAGTAAKYVRITAKDNWGGVLKQCGLSEVRFMVIPVSARLPQPAAGATGVDPRSLLSWRAGRDVARHKVYLSTDVNEVTGDKALVGTVSETRFDASQTLALGKTYYWKVVEVNEAETQAAWEGDVWSFSTAAFLPVDDMESYNDAEGKDTRVYEVWIDGWGTTTNGSQVGHDGAPFAELKTIHGGLQAMPLKYGRDGIASSEATRSFDAPQDWTQYGVKGLVVWFFGDPANTAGQLYVKVNGKKVAYDGDAANLLLKPWQMWYIDLAGFTGANLKKVTELTIGVDGGAGSLFIDDIGLSPLARQLVTPVQPAATNLVLQYKFEGDVKDSTGAHPGTVAGAPTYVPGKVGQAIQLNGVSDYVTVEGNFDLPEYSVALWFQVTGGSGQRDILAAYRPTGYVYGTLLEVGTDGQLRYLHRAPIAATGGTDLYSNMNYSDGAWYHVGIVKSADAMTIYVNGMPAATAANATPFDQAVQKLALGVLRSEEPSRYFPGLMDELSLYSRALSDAEMASLAGRTKPFDKP
jgi:hypothetical protein